MGDPSHVASLVMYTGWIKECGEEGRSPHVGRRPALPTGLHYQHDALLLSWTPSSINNINIKNYL